MRLPSRKLAMPMVIRGSRVFSRLLKSISLFSIHDSIGEVIPDHERHLDGHDAASYSKQVPAPEMVNVVVVGKQTDRHDTADDPRKAGGSEAVREKSFVDCPANDGHIHFLNSNVKILSVEQANTREKVSASRRLGTYRSRSIELML